jgi:hypothetical protein
MFANLQIRPAKPHRRKPSLATRAGVGKRRVSSVSAASTSNIPSMSFMQGLFGEEFPENFGHIKSRKTILDLPAEVFSIICVELSKLDIKRLRLASKRLAANVDLRIDRVYISPNRTNLELLRCILEHPKYRTHIREIVWDDAQLEEYPTLEVFKSIIDQDERETFGIIAHRLEQVISEYEDRSQDSRILTCSDFLDEDGRLTHIGKEILVRNDDRFTRYLLVKDSTLMSVEASYTLYQKLYREEQDCIKRQVDLAAFRRALSSLPALRKITLTSEVWRPCDLYSRYDTPFQRSLPPGFRKPFVEPWRSRFRSQSTPIYMDGRDETMGLSNQWRGYSIVISALAAAADLKVQEFVTDGGYDGRGISHQLFARPNRDLDHTVRMFRHGSLQRLQLAMTVHRSELVDGSVRHFGLLKAALAELQHLKHLDLNLNSTTRGTRVPVHPASGLFDISRHLPENLIESLKTFALRNVFMDEDDLFNLLLNMHNAQQVTMDNVCLTNSFNARSVEMNWSSLFRRLRSEHENDAPISKPKFAWIWPLYSYAYVDTRSRLIDEEIDAFVYRGGEDPFAEYGQDWGPNGVGWVFFDQEPERRIRMARYQMEEESTF